MVRRTRRWMLTSMAGLGASLVVAGRSEANTGQTLPAWGATSGTTDLQAGSLGLNPAMDPGQVPVAMRIPDAGVDAEVEHQKIVEGKMQDPSGPWVVAWYEGTARAGQVGNFVASGHVDYWGVGPSVFYEVAKLSEGALIEVIGDGEATYTYAVEYIRRIDVYDTTVEELNSPEMVGQTDYAAVTLITCGGNFNGQEYTQRDIIRGRLTKVAKADGESTDVAPPADSGDDEASDAALAEGATAVVIEDGVNLRSDATTSADVVTVLARDTRVTITGESREGDGFVWWPVELEDGTTGWVVEDFLQVAS